MKKMAVFIAVSRVLLTRWGLIWRLFCMRLFPGAVCFRILIGMVGLITGLVQPGFAQVNPDSLAADTTRVLLPDSLQRDRAEPDSALVADSVAVVVPVGLTEPEPGWALDSVVVIRTRFDQLADVLGEQPGSFLYDLGLAGFPSSWAPYALAPHRVGLTYDGLAFDDLFDGRPRYDLVPHELLVPLRQDETARGYPVILQATSRTFQTRRPLTELRYHSGQYGLQYISGMHVQDRSRALFGQPGRMNVLFRYGGSVSQGDYPNSKARSRQGYLRLRYEQAGWMIALSNGFAKWQRGVHGGISYTSVFDTIYNRFGANVRLSSAQHTTKRNDLNLTLRTRWMGALPPVTATLNWTSQVSRFVDQDTLSALMHRYGMRVRQYLRNQPGGHRMLIRFDTWIDRWRDGTAWADSLVDPQAQMHLALRNETRIWGGEGMVDVGLHRVGSTIYPSVGLHFNRSRGQSGWFLGTGWTGQAATLFERSGFGDVVIPSPSPPGTEQVLFGRLGGRVAYRMYDAQITLFTHRTNRYLDYYLTDVTDEVQIRQSDHPHTWVGLGSILGWRRMARRGFYGQFRFDLFRQLDATASDASVRTSTSLPEFTTDLRLGVRFNAFSEFKLDVYMRGRFWSAFRSRVFHPQTTLLVLPRASAVTLGPSGTLDLFLSGDIRGATLFLSMENVLSGWVYPGTLLVPIYPLPEQYVRFGVYWPFWD